MADPNSPELPPIEQRKSPRKRVLLGAKVVHSEGAYTVDCRIRDLSEDGARIVLGPGVVIPTRVVLVDTKNAMAYESEVVWLRPPEFGLKFLATHSVRGELPPHLRYVKRYV
jgi:hypothetical protein